MNTFFSKPYSILFSFTLVLGILITISSNNWIIAWIGLEINLYSFIPLLLQSSNNQEKEAAIKYFLIQAFASTLLLLANIYLSYSLWSIYIFIFSLLTKLGAAPCHFWFPPIIASLSWNICWLVSTLQKLAPLSLLRQTILILSPSYISLTAIIGTLIGGLGGFNQTQLRTILAYSSISHTGWILASILTSPFITILYFFSYLILITAIIYTLNTLSNYAVNFTLNPLRLLKIPKVLLIINILRLAGLPPLFGFFPKLILISSLIFIKIYFLSLILTLCSIINLYFYLKIISSIFFSFPQQHIILSPPSIPIRTLILTSILSIRGALFIFPLFI